MPASAQALLSKFLYIQVQDDIDTVAGIPEVPMRAPRTSLLTLTFLSVACSQPDARDVSFGQSQSALEVTGPAWTARVGTSGADAVSGVAIDSTGNVIVGGFAAAGLDSQTSAGGQDGLLVKYSASGTRQWTRLVGTNQADAVNAVAIGASDSIFVAGYLRAALDGQSNLGGQDLSLSKYDGAGNRLWTRTTGSTFNDWANAVVVRGGAVYVAGLTGKSLPGSTAVGRNDVAVARYDESGALAWQKSFGSTLDDAANGVAVDASGNVYVAGTTSGALPGTTAFGGKDVLVAKLSPTGALLWTKQFGTALDDSGTGVTIGSDGGIYVSGITAGALDGAQAGVTDAVLLKLDASGTQVWAKQLGGTALDEALGVAADSSFLYVTGRSLGQLPGANAGGLLNMFVAKYGLDGSLQAVREYSGGNASGATFAASAAAANGRVVIAGVTSAGAFDGVTGFGNNDGLLLDLCTGPGFACGLAGSCSTGHGGCTASQTCASDAPGYVLCGCASGQTGSNVCADVNECLVNNGGCDSRTTCTNTVGSRTCGACPSGYTGNGATGCVDRDECATSNGGCANACVNTPGSFQCTCGTGYTGDGVTCTDIDECGTNTDTCDPLTTCTNITGSFTCSDCPADYTGTGATGCICPAGYTGTGATGCTDVDECDTNNGGCDPLSICTNTSGSFVCGDCPAGYTGMGATGCSDVNECATVNGGCPGYQTCTNMPGSRTCGCPAGFWDNGSACVALAPAWSARVGSSGIDQINAVALDSTGNVLVGGFAAANVDGQTTAGGQDGLLTKYSSTGGKQWTRLVGTSQADAVNGVATGSSDSVYVAGYLRAALDGQPNLGGQDLWVSKYDTTGNRLWTRTTGSTSNDVANAVAVRNGRVFVAGLTGKSLPGNTAAGRNDIAVVRYDESGTLLWQKSFGSTLDDQANGLAAEAGGTVYLCGTTSGSLPGNTALGGKDLFVAKIDSHSSLSWVKQFGTALDDSGTGISIGADGGLYVSGITAGALGGPQGGVSDAVLLKLDTNGNLVWTKQLGGAALDEGLGVAADVSSVFLTGRSLGQLPGSNSGGLLNMFAAKYALDGTLQTVREYSGGNSSGSTFSAGVAAANGRFVIAGGTSAGGFDGVTGFGNTDGVLMSLCSDHNFACELAGTCTTNRGGCTASQTCTQDGVGFVQCGCGAGYTGSSVCAEVNECIVSNGGCDALTTCTNTVGSRTCGGCPSGYIGSGATGCVDTNECATGNGGCDALATCTNTPGSRTCACPAGFSGDGNSANSCFGSCSECDAHANCSGAGEADIAAICSCASGYQGTGTSCSSNTSILPSPLFPGRVDGNWCSVHDREWGTLFHVASSGKAIGLRYYRGPDWNSLGGATNIPGHLWKSNGTLLGTVTFSSNATGWHTAYFNQPIQLTAGEDYVAAYESGCFTFMLGAFSSPIDTGAIQYAGGGGDSNGFWIDPGNQLPTTPIGDAAFPFADVLFVPNDPCLANHGGCDALAACDGSSGVAVCGACPTGSTGNGSVPGGCASDCSACSAHATCTNTNGTVGTIAVCSCQNGYEGNGYACADINECGPGNGDCDTHATCTNTEGSYSCACNEHYQGDGHTCSCSTGYASDGLSCVDACTVNNGGCGEFGTCSHDASTHAVVCTCAEGYQNNGSTCVRDPCLTDNGGCGGYLPRCTSSAGAVTCACPLEGPCLAVTSVRFLIEGAFCGGEIGGNGDNRVDLYAGSRLLGTVGLDTYCYACGEGVTTEATFSDPSALTAITPPNTCGDVVRVVEHDPVGTRLGFIRADITRGDGSVEKQCLVDYSGYGCAFDNRNLCWGSDNQTRSTWIALPDANVDGVPDCVSCPAGTVNSGTACVDPCATNNGGCDAHVSCSLDGSTVVCGACPAGFTGNGQSANSCVDVNECATDNGGCDAHATCTNTDGSNTCACHEHYDGDGYTCEPDACVPDNGGCDALVQCTATTAGTFCGGCPAGFTGDGQTAGSCVGVCECGAHGTCLTEGVVDVAATCECDLGWSSVSSSCQLNDTVLSNRFTSLGNSGYYCVGVSLEIGTSFQVTTGGHALGIAFRRFYSETVVGHLWNQNTGALLATATFPGATGWQTAWLDTPIALPPGNYVASYETRNGCVTYLNNEFAADVVHGPITHPGGAASNSSYADPGAMPFYDLESNAFGFVDIVFQSECLVDNGGCDSHVSCDASGSSVACGTCPAGYHGSGYVSLGGCVQDL